MPELPCQDLFGGHKSWPILGWPQAHWLMVAAMTESYWWGNWGSVNLDNSEGSQIASLTYLVWPPNADILSSGQPKAFPSSFPSFFPAASGKTRSSKRQEVLAFCCRRMQRDSQVLPPTWPLPPGPLASSPSNFSVVLGNFQWFPNLAAHGNFENLISRPQTRTF